MGIFSFLKNAGAKLFGHKEAEKPATNAGTTAPNADVAAMVERQKEEMLANLVNSMNLDISNLSVDLQGDTAVIFGDANTQADKEKAILTIGNVGGIAHVDDRMNVLNVEPEAKFYEVQKGDSLSKIAKHFYGDAMKYTRIFKANQPMLKSPDLIYPGQMLRIPA